jgi:hypothetical protein
MDSKKNKTWSAEEEKYLIDNFESQTFKELADNIDRPVSGIMHKCSRLGLKRKGESAKVGDVIKGWKIVEIYSKNQYGQNISYAKVESTINDKIGEYKLTQLTNRCVGWPDRRRPDVSNKAKLTTKLHKQLYSRYHSIKNRCYNKNQLSYKNYGGRGITVCEEWLGPNGFDNFYDWAIINGYDENLSLDRIDNDGNYEPSNCKWANLKEQRDNRRISINITAFGETKNASDWALDTRCRSSYTALVYRISQGWDSETAISRPSKNNKYNFRKYKSFYYFVRDNHPEIVEEFMKQLV